MWTHAKQLLFGLIFLALLYIALKNHEWRSAWGIAATAGLIAGMKIHTKWGIACGIVGLFLAVVLATAVNFGKPSWL